MSYSDTRNLEECEKFLKENSQFETIFAKKKRFDFEFDLNFLQITPSLGINFYFSEIEFVWLFFGIYFRYSKVKKYDI